MEPVPQKYKKGLQAEAAIRFHHANESGAAASDSALLAEVNHELRVYQVELEAQNQELLRTQAELTASRDRYCSLFDAAPVGYLRLRPDGEIVAANLTSSVMLQHDRDDMIGRHLQALVSPDEADQLHQLYRDVVSQKAHPACGLKIVQPDGCVSCLYVQCILEESVAAAEPSIRMTLSDVTLLKDAEARRAELEVRLHQKQRLASLGVLAGGIAHDFNNLLFGILSHADLLLLGDPTPSQKMSAQQIQTAATQSAELCSQMLDFAGKRQLVKSVFRLPDVIDEMSDLLLTTFKARKVSFNCVHSSDVPCIEGDVTRIRQVVMNIILNAAESMGADEGPVSVTTGSVSIDSNDANSPSIDDGLVSGEYVVLEVVDSGCGIEKESLSKVFEPFFTTKFSGRGLGLASVLGIVRGHGGTITIDSEPGSGTTVRVYLPATNKPAAIRDNPMVGPVTAKGQSTVLLVDDEEIVRLAMQTKLRRQGYSVKAASGGAEALELLEQYEGRVDIVVLDLTMPGLSTETICKSLHKKAPDLPVLLMSGYSEEEALNRCECTNIAGFVPKPLGDVAQAVGEILQPAC